VAAEKVIGALGKFKKAENVVEKAIGAGREVTKLVGGAKKVERRVEQAYKVAHKIIAPPPPPRNSANHRDTADHRRHRR